MTKHEDTWDARLARLRALNDECFDLFLDIVELLGGEEHYPNPSLQRGELLLYVMHLPRFNGDARRRALYDPL